MRLLVTGASGPFGAHWAKRMLSDGHDVMSIRHGDAPYDTAFLLGIRDKIRWGRGSLDDELFCKRVVAEFEPNLIVHFAALIVQAPTRTTVPIFQTNFMGTVHLLEAAREATSSGKNTRFIYVSTDKSYGDAGARPYTEDMPLNPLGAYDCSKAAADMAARFYCSSGLVPAIAVVRPCNILAPGDLNITRVVPRTVLSCLRGERPRLYRTTYLREFIHIDDAIDGILAVAHLLETGEAYGQAFNIGSGEQRNLDGVVSAVLKHFPGIHADWSGPSGVSRAQVPFQPLDCAKIERATGWRAKRSFDEAVDAVVCWWRERWPHVPDGIRNLVC